jgi:siderophore synthetase component
MPLLHCLFAHDLVFMPHGENVIMVLEGSVPARVFMKDIAEEVAILNKDAKVPERVQRVVIECPDDMKVLAIFTDVFDCFFRFLAPILLESCGYAENRFWERVAECVIEYQRSHPELQGKFERLDLFSPTFVLSCLNRLQLKNNRQMVNLADPFASLTLIGTLDNPIAQFRPGAPRVGLAE